jgi:hypothetical protein
MMSAAAILDRSLDKGLTEEFVQWDTFRGTRSFVTNCTQASVAGLSDSVGAYERKKMWISGVVTHSFWFSRFMEGLHKRVGEVRHQDEPVTIDVLLAIEDILEKEWRRSDRPQTRRRVAEMGAWFILGFCSGVRGEEMLLMEFAGTSKSLEFMNDPECPHFIATISGRTKGNQLSGAKFGIPIAATTERSHLQPGKWISRLCKIWEDGRETTGRLFRRHLNPSRLSEFEFDFYKLLREVQATTPHIKHDMVVESEYGILRSLRRGMTAHARNMTISRDDLEPFNRWRQEMSSQTGFGRLDMMETYSQLNAIKPTILRVTRAF